MRCLNCQKPTKYRGPQQGYSTYCGKRCQKEYKNKQQVQKLVDFGFDYLGGYENSHSKVEVRNRTCNHVFKATYLNLFTNNNYCPTCGKKDRTEQLANRNREGIPEKARQRLIERNAVVAEEARIRKESPEYSEWMKYSFYARKATMKTYYANKDVLEIDGKVRSPEWHLDHIVSIAECYRRGIPHEKCASLENLRIISAWANCSRKDKLDDVGISLLEKWTAKKDS